MAVERAMESLRGERVGIAWQPPTPQAAWTRAPPPLTSTETEAGFPEGPGRGTRYLPAVRTPRLSGLPGFIPHRFSSCDRALALRGLVLVSEH